MHQATAQGQTQPFANRAQTVSTIHRLLLTPVECYQISLTAVSSYLRVYEDQAFLCHWTTLHSLTHPACRFFRCVFSIARSWGQGRLCVRAHVGFSTRNDFGRRTPWFSLTVKLTLKIFMILCLLKSVRKAIQVRTARRAIRRCLPQR
jgi:hypothetical protein